MTTSDLRAAPLTAGLDFDRFFGALDARRRERGLTWFELADEAWQLSRDLNAALGDHPLCGGAVSRLGARGETSCQYAMTLLRWLDRTPDDFVPGTPFPGQRLTDPGPGRRLRWDLAAVHRALDDHRRARGLSWAALADELRTTTGRLTHLRTGRHCELALAVAAAHRVGRPSTAFLVAASW